MISLIFFLSGFIYGFLDSLNAEFRIIAGDDRLTSFELHATFYCAYMVSPILVAFPILKQKGFKVTLITGLGIYACGALIFWPSAILLSLPAFFLSNFIVGAGIAVIETSVNLFASLCGPMRLSEIRLNLVRGILNVGVVLSPFLAERVLFGNLRDAPSLIRVQWTYLAISLFAVLLAVICYYLPVPDVSDEDLGNLIQDPPDHRPVLCGVHVTWVTIAVGTFSLFCFVGARENLETKFRTLVLELVPA
jgi:fucose permease